MSSNIPEMLEVCRAALADTYGNGNLIRKNRSARSSIRIDWT